MRSGIGAGDSFGTYLNRKKAWMGLREQVALEQRRLVPYIFRHTCRLHCHRRGIHAGTMAHSMNRSLEVHLRSYPWASASNRGAFALATKRRRSITGRRLEEAMEA